MYYLVPMGDEDQLAVNWKQKVLPGLLRRVITIK